MPSSRSVVRRKLKDGSVKTYVYKRKKAPETGTVGWLRRIYLNSPDFAALAPASQRYYKLLLHELDGIREMPVSDVEIGHIAHIRDRLAEDRKGLANLFVGVCSALFKWAMLRGHRKTFNPAHTIPRIALRERGSWPDWALEKAEAEMVGPPRLAFMLALYGGQRQGDILAMTWAQYDGIGIALKQSKTGEELYIPCAAPLKAALDEAKAERRAIHIIASLTGSYTQSAFRHVWGLEMKRLGLTGLVFHGLRHTAATRLAEAGCSEREIMAVTGHRSPLTVSKYVRKAKQRTMAEAAIIKLGAKR
jgi:integrase